MNREKTRQQKAVKFLEEKINSLVSKYSVNLEDADNFVKEVYTQGYLHRKQLVEDVYLTASEKQKQAKLN